MATYRSWAHAHVSIIVFAYVNKMTYPLEFQGPINTVGNKTAPTRKSPHAKEHTK